MKNMPCKRQEISNKEKHAKYALQIGKKFRIKEKM